MEFQLNDQVLVDITKDISNKEISASEKAELINEIFTYLQMQSEDMKNSSAYNAASIIRSYSNWYDNKSIEPDLNRKIDKREVYYVDLGSFNLKYEEGYLHPCVVIKQYQSSVLVIPGSTKSYYRKDNLIFKVKGKDGFIKDTGVMIDQIRVVSVTRLGKKLGKMKAETFKELNDLVIDKFFGYKAQEVKELNAKQTKSLKQIEELKKENEELRERIIKLEEILNESSNIAAVEGDN